MVRVRVVVEADIRPTEDEEKVKQALLKIIDPETVRIEGETGIRRIVMESSSLHSLERLRRLLRTERILDAARKMMRRGLEKDRVVFALHKQALTVGKLSFISGDNESPLGAVTVTIIHPEPKKVVDWLAPPTVRGRPIFEIEEPP
jgi:predicted RNA binding protein with dsRBD fold (UPF0201 family)